MQKFVQFSVYRLNCFFNFNLINPFENILQARILRVYDISFENGLARNVVAPPCSPFGQINFFRPWPFWRSFFSKRPMDYKIIISVFILSYEVDSVLMNENFLDHLFFLFLLAAQRLFFIIWCHITAFWGNLGFDFFVRSNLLMLLLVWRKLVAMHINFLIIYENIQY